MNMTQSILSALTSKKSTLKIRINNCFNHIFRRFDVITLIEPMKALISTLHSKCDDWTFILYGLTSRNQSKTAEIMSFISALNIKDGYNAILNLRENDWMDIVVRSDCMSGIHEPWIMTCNECSLTSNGVVFK